MKKTQVPGCFSGLQVITVYIILPSYIGIIISHKDPIINQPGWLMECHGSGFLFLLAYRWNPNRAPCFLLEKAFVGWGWPPKIEVIWVLGIYQIFPPNKSGFIRIPSSNMSGHFDRRTSMRVSGWCDKFHLQEVSFWHNEKHETPQKSGHCITNPSKAISMRMNIIYIHTYNYIYHLESRWLATPISLGLSWSLTNRHRTWELRKPSTFTMVYIIRTSLPSLTSPSWGCPTATKRCKFRPAGPTAVPRVSTRAQVRVVKLAIVGSECIKNWDEYTWAMKKSRGPLLSMSHRGCLKTGSSCWLSIIPIYLGSIIPYIT